VANVTPGPLGKVRVGRAGVATAVVGAGDLQGNQRRIAEGGTSAALPARWLMVAMMSSWR
jgi:hypothetical protein